MTLTVFLLLIVAAAVCAVVSFVKYGNILLPLGLLLVCLALLVGK